jgi:hypothetical protein
MVSAARAQYLKPTRGFQSNSFAFSLSSLALMGWLPMLESMPFILTTGDRQERKVSRKALWRNNNSSTRRRVTGQWFAYRSQSCWVQRKKNTPLPRASKKCGGMHAEWKGWRHTAWLELPVLGRVSIVESKTDPAMDSKAAFGAVKQAGQLNQSWVGRTDHDTGFTLGSQSRNSSLRHRPVELELRRVFGFDVWPGTHIFCLSMGYARGRLRT